jgi:hypothetical protein
VGGSAGSVNAGDGGTWAAHGGSSGENTVAGRDAAEGGAEQSGGEGPDSLGASGASNGSECPSSDPLQPDEEDGGAYDGDLEITSPELASQLGTYSIIRGDLWIGPVAPSHGPLLSDIELSHVRVVEGSLLIRNTGLIALSMPRLERVTGQLWISLNQELTRVSLPQLRSTGDFFLDANLKLLTTDFPELETITGQLYVHRNIALTSWGLDALRTIETGVTISANLALPTCLVDALGEATGLELTSTFTGGTPPPNCTCSSACGRIVPQCN